MRIALAAASLLALCAPAAFAHTTVSVDFYDIEVGWGLEPPVVGIWNTFVFHVTEPGEREGVKTGVINAFRDMSATATFGGVTKTLEVNSDPRPGFYFANVIPTRTGSYSVMLEGEILGTPVDVLVSSQDIEALKAAVTSMQAEIDRMEGSPATAPAGGASYDMAVMGVSLGAAAVILGVVALVRRPRA